MKILTNEQLTLVVSALLEGKSKHTFQALVLLQNLQDAQVMPAAPQAKPQLPAALTEKDNIPAKLVDK